MLKDRIDNKLVRGKGNSCYTIISVKKRRKSQSIGEKFRNL